jgi:hypothetical protein
VDFNEVATPSDAKESISKLGKYTTLDEIDERKPPDAE